MANYVFSVPVADEGGRMSSISGFLVAADDAAATAAIVSMLTDADVLIGGKIGEIANLTKQIDVSAATLKATAAAGSDRAKKAKFTFSDGAGHNKLLTLPTFLDTIYGSPSRDIDTTDEDVAAFVTEIISGGYTTNRFEDLTTIVKAVESYGD